MKTKLVITSRETESNFFKNTATGKSLSRQKKIFELELILFVENKEGLPKIYNQIIYESKNQPVNLIFAHDDLHFIDFFWYDKIIEGLQFFQILGIVGNKRRVKNQPTWFATDKRFVQDEPNLSGIIGHGYKYPPENISYYGPARQRVMLLDGLLLATNSQILLDNNIKFDEQFDFHFYDMDFCRQAEKNNIKCGTWDISLIHESSGILGSADWESAYEKYLEKWKD